MWNWHVVVQAAVSDCVGWALKHPRDARGLGSQAEARLQAPPPTAAARCLACHPARRLTSSRGMDSTAGGSASSRLQEVDRKRRERARGCSASQSAGASAAVRCHALCRYSTFRRVNVDSCGSRGKRGGVPRGGVPALRPRQAPRRVSACSTAAIAHSTGATTTTPAAASTQFHSSCHSRALTWWGKARRQVSDRFSSSRLPASGGSSFKLSMLEKRFWETTKLHTVDWTTQPGNGEMGSFAGSEGGRGGAAAYEHAGGSGRRRLEPIGSGNLRQHYVNSCSVAMGPAG